MLYIYMVPARFLLGKRGVPASVFEFCRTFTWPIIDSFALDVRTDVHKFKITSRVCLISE